MATTPVDTRLGSFSKSSKSASVRFQRASNRSPHSSVQTLKGHVDVGNMRLTGIRTPPGCEMLPHSLHTLACLSAVPTHGIPVARRRLLLLLLPCPRGPEPVPNEPAPVVPGISSRDVHAQPGSRQEKRNSDLSQGS